MLEANAVKHVNEQVTLADENSPAWLRTFVDVYQSLSTDNLELLTKIYHSDVCFMDPMHQLQGLDELSSYFNALYENLSTCEFVINNVIHQQEQAAIYWTMSYQHPKLNSGNTIQVEGHSYIKGRGDKVVYHRDYLDLGAMLYEHLPLIGKLISWLKKRVAQ